MEGKEYSADLGDDGTTIEALGLMDEDNIYDGCFDMKVNWIPKLQPLFSHKVDATSFDYQIFFRYRKDW
jgi:hypothetical protein